MHRNWWIAVKMRTIAEQIVIRWSDRRIFPRYFYADYGEKTFLQLRLKWEIFTYPCCKINFSNNAGVYYVYNFSNSEVEKKIDYICDRENSFPSCKWFIFCLHILGIKKSDPTIKIIYALIYITFHIYFF